MRASSSSEHEAVVTRHASRAVKETSKKSDSPDTRADIWRWAVETNQLAENQLAENSRLAVARERTPCTTRKKAPQRQLSSSRDELTSYRCDSSSARMKSSSCSNEVRSPSACRASTTESSFDTNDLSSSSDSETLVARPAKGLRK